MKKKIFWVLIAVILFVIPATVLAGELESFIGSLNVEARADLPGFKTQVSAQFGVPVPKVDVLMRSLPSPGDVYMCLRIGQVANISTDVVLREYKTNKGKGWGVIAKNLGIKPGSKEFHELKKGGFEAKGKEKGKGNKSSGINIDIGGGGKGKGHKK